MVYFPATVKERQKSFRKTDYFLEFGTHGPRNYIGAKTIKTQESITEENFCFLGSKSRDSRRNAWSLVINFRRNSTKGYSIKLTNKILFDFFNF